MNRGSPAAKRGRVGEVLLELAIVFVGVLMALFADSLMQDRGERQRELSYLRALQSDMTEASAVISDVIHQDSLFAEGARSQLAIVRGDKEPASGANPTDVTAFRMAPFPIPVGTLQTLVTSGDLRLIRSDELRRTLIAESATLAWHLGWVEEVMSQAGDNVRRTREAREVLRIEGRTQNREITFEDARNSPVIVAGLATYVSQLSNVIGSLRSARAAVMTIDAAVSQELAR